jgi:type II secretory pathway pseudopilin PulG
MVTVSVATAEAGATMNVIALPVGARSGVFTHWLDARAQTAAATTIKYDRRELRRTGEERITMTEAKNSMRRLARSLASSEDGGYILAVLLVAMAIAAIWMSASLPAWRQQAQRQREIELRFRGEQYARAIALYFVKNGTLPTEIDQLVSQRFLRKKWKDPITGEDFVPVLAGQAQGSTSGRSGTGPGLPTPPQQGRGPTPIGSQQGIGGITGVMSKSTGTSIIIYNGQQEYDLWAFNYLAACLKMGANCQRGGGPGGGPGGRPGGAGPGGGRPGGGGPGPVGGGAPAGGRPGGGRQ